MLVYYAEDVHHDIIGRYVGTPGAAIPSAQWLGSLQGMSAYNHSKCMPLPPQSRDIGLAKLKMIGV